jgi:hypothetical protein
MNNKTIKSPEDRDPMSGTEQGASRFPGSGQNLQITDGPAQDLVVTKDDL